MCIAPLVMVTLLSSSFGSMKYISTIKIIINIITLWICTTSTTSHNPDGLLKLSYSQKFKSKEYTYINIVSQKVGYAVNPPIHQKQSSTTQPNPTHRLGRYLGVGGLDWLAKFYFTVSWVECGLAVLQIRLTQPDPPMFDIYLKYILYSFIIYYLGLMKYQSNYKI